MEWALLSAASTLLLLALQFGSLSTLMGDALFDLAQGRDMPPPSSDIVVVSLDNDSLDKLGGWPLSRQRYAALLEQLRASGAKPRAIGFDLLFLEPRPDDAELTRAMQGLPVVLPVELRPAPQGEIRIMPPTVGGPQTRLAHIDILPDNDGRVRQVNPLRGGYPQFAYAMAGIPLGVDARLPARFARIADGAAFPMIGLADLLDNPYSARQLDGKYVLVGATAASLGDLYPVSGEDGGTRFMPGILLHANILNSLLQQRNISLAGPWLAFAASLPLLLAFLLGLLLLSADRAELAATLGVLLAALALCGMSLWWGRIWINPAGLIITLLLTRPAWSWLRMRQLVTRLQNDLSQAQQFLPAAALPASGTPHPVWDSGDELVAGINRLSGQTEFLQHIINRLPDAVFIFSPAQELWLSNARARDIMSRLPEGRESGLRQLILQLGGECDHLGRLRPESLQRRLNLEHNGLPCHYQLQVHQVSEDEQRAWLIMSMADITDTIRAQEQRERAMQLLSHDMRTPVITLITLCRHAHEQGQLPAEDYARVTDNTDLLLAYMDDFILSIKAERERYQTHEILLSELLAEAAAKVRPLADRLGMSMDEVEDEAMLFVEVDNRLMLRVFINLLFNAVNHGETPGRVSISIRADEGWAVVRIGNRKAADGGNNARHTGYGLGNGFVDNVVRRHGGEVTRHIPEQAGAEVWVEIRLKSC